MSRTTYQRWLNLCLLAGLPILTALPGGAEPALNSQWSTCSVLIEGIDQNLPADHEENAMSTSHAEAPTIVFAGPEGTRWRLAEMGGKPVPLPAGGNPPNLLLDAAQKRASGFAGCNNFFATYTLEGDSLKFGPVGATRRACPDAEAAVEAEFLKVLEKTRGWKMPDQTLLLLDEKQVLARFTRMDSEKKAPDLDSLTVRSTLIPSGKVTLSRGEYQRPAAPGSASTVSVKLSDKRAFGTLNGKETGAVVLVVSTGGSGVFSELALLAGTADGWENTDTVLLGDRVKVHSVAIQEDAIVVAMTAHGPKDPACCPTLEVTKRFPVRENRLGSAGEDTQIAVTVWQWVQTLTGDDKKFVPPKPQNYTIQFREDGTINVKADCNRKGGKYSVQDGKLSIEITHSTMAMCEEGSLEEPFVRQLTGAAGFFLQDGDLYIDLKYDSGTMRFRRQAPLP